MIRLISGILLVLIIGNNVYAQDFESRLNSTLQTYWGNSSGIPGVGVSVITPSKDTVFTSVGIGNTITSSPIDENSQFIVASISKTFTSALLLRMQEEGLIDINNPLSDYLSIAGLDQTITIRQIMNHSSGIYDHFDSNSFWSAAVGDPYKVWTDSEVLGYSIPNGLTHQPGEKYNYSNTGFYILGMLINEILGVSPEQALFEWITEPLNLNNTFLDDSSDPGNKIPGLAENYRAYEYHKSPVSTAGAVVSTPKDVARFLNAVFDGDFLTVASKNSMITPSFANTNYGLGTRLWYSDDGNFYYGHTGTLSGYKGFACYIPEINASLTILANGYADPISGWENLVDAIYYDVVSEFNNCNNGVCPAPPAPILTQVTHNNTGGIDISWSLNVETYVSGYRLYYSTLNNPENWELAAGESQLNEITDSYSFQSGNDFIVPSVANAHNIKLVAVTTDGKESFASDIYGYANSNLNKKLLIVDGFDRFSGSGSWGRSTHTFGADYLEVFEALPGRDYAIDVVANEMISASQISLLDYDYVIWFTGDESTVDETFSSSEQYRVRLYLENGGNLFVTGSEIGWDLYYKGTTSDRNFYTNYLKATLADDGSSNNGPATGIVETLFAGVSLDYGVIYMEDYPDELTPNNGGQKIMRYQDGSAAGMAFSGPFGPGEIDARMVYLAFPMESVNDKTSKVDFASNVKRYFDRVITDTVVAICEGETYLLGTQELSEPGSYKELFQAVSGNDSLVNLTLTMNPTYNETQTLSIEYGEEFILGNQILTETGTYTKVFESIHGCDSTVTVNLSVIMALDDLTKEEISVYPNPFDNQLTIEIDRSHKIKRLVIVDLSGKVFLDKRLDSAYDITIDTNNIPCGMYVLMIETENKKVLNRSILKR
ncbi:MAG: serine hydrolase [Bacteroidota bacterium]